MDCFTTATRRSKTFAELHALPILRPLPTVLLHIVSEYTVAPFLAGCRDGQIWIRQDDGEQQPWRVGFSNLVLPNGWPNRMAVANRHLLVLQPSADDSHFSEENIVALPLDTDTPNRTEWRDMHYHCEWRLLVLSCGTPIVLHFLRKDNRQAFLYFRNVRHRVPLHLFHYSMHWTTTVIWNDCLILFGGYGAVASQVTMWNPTTTEWHRLPSLRQRGNLGLPFVTPLGLLLAGGLTAAHERSCLIQCLPSPQSASWTVLDWQLPAGANRYTQTWFVNGRLFVAPSDKSNRCWSLLIRPGIQTSDWSPEPNTPHDFTTVFTL